VLTLVAGFGELRFLQGCGFVTTRDLVAPVWLLHRPVESYQ
jgi:hypothetical protein